jgi:hypothetical protein
MTGPVLTGCGDLDIDVDKPNIRKYVRQGNEMLL